MDGGTTPSSSSSGAIVFVWDLDETLILFNSLFHASSMAEGAAGRAAKRAAEAWAGVVFEIMDQHFHFREVENDDPIHIDDVMEAASSGEAMQASEEGGGSSGRPPCGEVAAVMPACTSDRGGGEAKGPKSSHSLPDAGTSEVNKSGESPSHVGGAATIKAPSLTEGGPGTVAPPAPGLLHLGPGTLPTRADHADVPGRAVAATASTDPVALGRLRRKAELYRLAEVAYKAGLASLLLSEPERERMQTAWGELMAASSGWSLASARLLHTLAEKHPLPSDISAKAEGDSADGVGPVGEGGGGGLGRVPGGQRGGKEESLPHVVHCVVSRGNLMATLVKLLLFHLSDHISPRDVYSASEAPKVSCFERIKAKYGPESHYVAIGDGPEEEHAAATLGWPFVKVRKPSPASRGQSHQDTYAIGELDPDILLALACPSEAAVGRRVL